MPLLLPYALVIGSLDYSFEELLKWAESAK